MKTAVTVLLATVLAMGLAYAHTDVTPSQVEAMIQAGGPLTILDVREESEFCDTTSSPPGHIPGAVSMPWISGYLEDHYGELSTDEDIVAVCRSGGRSHLAATFLDGQGFTSVFDMVGGMNAWSYETELCGVSSVTDAGVFQPVLALEPIRPNPFTASAEIVYRIPQGAGTASLCIYDTRGHLVTRLACILHSSGAGRAIWNGTDRNGRSVAGGVYFCRLSSDGESVARPIVLAR